MRRFIARVLDAARSLWERIVPRRVRLVTEAYGQSTLLWGKSMVSQALPYTGAALVILAIGYIFGGMAQGAATTVVMMLLVMGMFIALLSLASVYSQTREDLRGIV